MVRILVAGDYDNYLLTYHCIAEYKDGTRERICSTSTGSEIEAKVQAIETAIVYAMQRKQHKFIIYTPFKQVLAYIKSGWSPQTKIIKDFMSLVKKIDTNQISFSHEIPEEFLSTYNNFVKLLGNKPTADNNNNFIGDRKSKWILTIPFFRVTLYDKENNVKLDLTNYDFGEDLLDAIEFCDWYDKESLDYNSTFYGWHITRYNVPFKKAQTPAQPVQTIPYTNTDYKETEHEQIAFGSGRR